MSYMQTFMYAVLRTKIKIIQAALSQTNYNLPPREEAREKLRHALSAQLDLHIL